ncbi:MAG: ABC transporter ATP-binding protein [bacterium]
MKIIELKNIIHFYNEKKALDVPELFIEKGKTYCIVGPNGSGKTTLLSIMSLLFKPSEGQIFFEGRHIRYNDDFSQKLIKSMTMVLQNPYLFNMSVGKNVAYGLYPRKLPRKEREARVRVALEMVGLSGFEKRAARELSGGEAQLVALARALALVPVVLFLDEPTANVDLRHMRRFEGIISRINKEQGTTIIMTSHNLSQAYRMAEIVISIFDGSLVPSAMHNLFAGNIYMKEKGLCFDTGEIQIWISADAKCTNCRHIAIDPEDIIVSKKPFVSSARNLFEGTITNITDQGGSILLEVGSAEIFRALITAVSLKEMDLNVGSHVYLTFKASSVHLL